MRVGQVNIQDRGILETIGTAGTTVAGGRLWINFTVVPSGNNEHAGASDGAFAVGV